jgi:hypothetical protein
LWTPSVTYCNQDRFDALGIDVLLAGQRLCHAAGTCGVHLFPLRLPKQRPSKIAVITSTLLSSKNASKA